MILFHHTPACLLLLYIGFCVSDERAAVSPLAEEQGQGSNYTYPEADDDRFLCYLLNFQSRVGSVDIEAQFWARAQAFFERVGDGECYHLRYGDGDSGSGRLVDIGCGTGRIVKIYGHLFEHVDCIEADPNRLSKARDGLSNARDELMRHESWSLGRVDFHAERFLDWKSEGTTGGADAVTVIHVVQHIPEYESKMWLKKIQGTLAPGGILALTTTVSNRGHSYYTIEGTEVDVDQFNDHAATGGAKHDHSTLGLAVLMFDAQELHTLIKGAEMHILENGTYMINRHTGEAEAQYVIATRAMDANLWQSCLPLEYLQPPRYARTHLKSIEETLRVRHQGSCDKYYQRELTEQREAERSDL
mmetsp:Transcript_102743/g.219725  ORF Transcript_102743/g.219725 Transcript_102743/m.219725 type:complete len:360 (-) Transcript_102743:68-1147(-)